MNISARILATPVTVLTLLICVHTLLAAEDELNRLAALMFRPEIAAAGFVMSIEKEFSTPEKRMNAACRNEIMAIMTTASEKREEKFGNFKKRREILGKYFDTFEAIQISNFLQSDVGLHVQIMLLQFSAGWANTVEERKEAMDSTFSQDEQKWLWGFLDSPVGQAFQQKGKLANADFVAEEAKFEQETMQILKSYLPQVDVIMKKYGY